MKIGFIGAGKVGSAFGLYLFNNGFSISGYYSKSICSASQCAKLTNSDTFDTLHQLVNSANIIFITTNDDEIKKVSKILSNHELTSNHIIIHMSGALSSQVLKDTKDKGCCVYSMHPLQAFTNIDDAVKQLPNTYFSIEGDKEKIHILENILTKTENPYFILDKEDKSLYHASACVFSNFIVDMIHEGLELLSPTGIDSELAFKAMLPLINGTLTNIDKHGCETALTGPIARGDSLTIKNHLKTISIKTPQQLDFYKYMCNRTLTLAKKSQLKDKSKIQKLENILNGGN